LTDTIFSVTTFWKKGVYC